MNICKLYDEFYLEKSDEKKAAFDQKLISTKFKINGVKTSDIESFAKTLFKENVDLNLLPLSCYEDILIKGFLIAKQKDQELKKKDPNKIYIFQVGIFYNLLNDNWGSCDMICSRLKKMDGEEKFFQELLYSSNPFYKRFGIVWLKNFVLKKDVKNTITQILEVSDDNYYVKMAQAWAVADGFVFDFESAFEVLKTYKDDFIVRKSISKANDSFRITKESKEILKKYLKEWKEKKC